MSSRAHPRRRDSSASRLCTQLARTLLARTHRRAIDVAPRPTTKAAAAYGAMASMSRAKSWKKGEEQRTRLPGGLRASTRSGKTSW